MSAHDPITGDDVPVTCHPVHEADDADDLADHVVKVLDRSFSHDPHEGCVGSYTLLVDDECPECGSNRLCKSVMVLPGVHTVNCPACDHTVDQG